MTESWWVNTDRETFKVLQSKRQAELSPLYGSAPVSNTAELEPGPGKAAKKIRAQRDAAA